MAKNFRQLEAKMSPRALARSDAKAEKMIQEMALHELRKHSDVAQERLAKAAPSPTGARREMRGASHSAKTKSGPPFEKRKG